MKKLTLVIALMAAVLIGSVSAEIPLPGASPEKTAGPTCKQHSRTPEVYTFYGDGDSNGKDIMVEQLAKIKATLSERRVFLQMTQGDSKAEVKLYEQQDGGKFKVTKWTPKETSSLVSEIDREIIANGGEVCVGETVKDLLTRLLGSKPDPTPTPVPDSPKAAFKDSVMDASGKFIKTTLIILC